MDDLAEALREDAERIDGRVSSELDARIRASLESIARPAPERRRGRPGVRAIFWWASGLTGAALSVVLIVVLNRPGPGIEGPESVPLEFVVADLPARTWRVEPAALTSALEQEYASLKSDLEEAEGLVRKELEKLF